MSAGRIFTLSISPSVSTTAWRLRSLTFLPASQPTGSGALPPFRAPDALTVDDRGGRTGLLAGLFPGLDVKLVVQLRKRPVALPANEVAMHRRARRQVARQRSPLATRFENVEDRVQHLAKIDLAPPPRPCCGTSTSGFTSTHSASVMSLGYRRPYSL